MAGHFNYSPRAPETRLRQYGSSSKVRHLAEHKVCMVPAADAMKIGTYCVLLFGTGTVLGNNRRYITVVHWDGVCVGDCETANIVPHPTPLSFLGFH